MTTLHPLSHGTPLSEFDIFSVPPTQLSVVNDIETEHRPLLPMSNDRLAVFEFTTAPNEYVKWTETEIYMKLRIKLTALQGAVEFKRTDWEKIKTEPNFMHTMIQSLNLSINGRVVTKSSITYPYRAFVDTLIGYSDDAKESHLSSILWTKNPARMMPRATATDLTVGEYFELRGKLCLDLAQQGRAMVGGCTFKLELRFNNPEMAFTRPADLKYNIDWDISNLTLLVHRTVVSDGTLAAHIRALQHATAKYPITRHEIKTVTVNAGLMDVMLDSIFTGQLPRRILVGFVKASAFRGSFTRELFNFEHLNINHLSFNIDGRSYPRAPYTPDFENELFMREYYSCLQTFNQDTISPVFTLSMEDYLESRAFFCYNFAPDLSDGYGVGGYLNLIKSGSLGMHVRFTKQTPEPYIAIVFAEFDNLIQIDKNNQVTTDYII